MGTIEQLIQQPKFQSEYHRAYISMLYLTNSMEGSMQQFFKGYGITSQQYNALRILRGQHPRPATVGLIKERMIDRNSDASRIVERLRKQGLVERIVCPKDRRAVDVVITDQGLEILKQIDVVLPDTEGMIRQLDKKEIAQLNHCIDKMLAYISHPH